MEYPIRGTLVAAARVFLCFFVNGARVDEKCRARLRAKRRFLNSARKIPERLVSTWVFTAIVVFPWIYPKDFGCLKNICYNKQIVRFIMMNE